MTLPYLPGWGDTLAQTLPQIGKSLSQLANPNQDVQRALQMAIAQNPGIAQQLGNLDPSVMQGIFGRGKTTDAITSMGVDPGEQVRRQTAQLTQDTLKNPDVAADVGLLNTVGQTGAARTIDQSRAKVASATADSQIRSADVNLERDELALIKDHQEAQLFSKNFANQIRNLEAADSVTGQDIRTQAINVAAGRPASPELQRAIQADPALASLFEETVVGLRKEIEQSYRMSFEQFRQRDPAVKSGFLQAFNSDIIRAQSERDATLKQMELLIGNSSPARLQEQAINEAKAGTVDGPKQKAWLQYQALADRADKITQDVGDGRARLEALTKATFKELGLEKYLDTGKIPPPSLETWTDFDEIQAKGIAAELMKPGNDPAAIKKVLADLPQQMRDSVARRMVVNTFGAESTKEGTRFPWEETIGGALVLGATALLARKGFKSRFGKAAAEDIGSTIRKPMMELPRPNLETGSVHGPPIPQTGVRQPKVEAKLLPAEKKVSPIFSGEVSGPAIPQGRIPERKALPRPKEKASPVPKSPSVSDAFKLKQKVLTEAERIKQNSPTVFTPRRDQRSVQQRLDSEYMPTQLELLLKRLNSL